MLATRHLTAATMAGLLLCFARASSSAPAHSSSTAAAALQRSIPAGFVPKRLDTDGGHIYYLTGGAGPPLILLHGFPEDSSAWWKVMSALAQRFRVVVPDLRGIGRSVTSSTAWDARSEAGDIWRLAATLKLARPYVIGQDMGAPIAYALARLHPHEMGGIMLIEGVLPGLQPFDKVAASPRAWHIDFQQMPNLPEALITGRLAPYFRDEFFNIGLADKNAVGPATLQRYVAAYSTPAQLRAGLGAYRAIPIDARFDQKHHETLRVPITVVGGAKGIGTALRAMVTDLRAHGCTEVAFELADGGHYLADENPAAVVAAIERHAANYPAR